MKFTRIWCRLSYFAGSLWSIRIVVFLNFVFFHFQFATMTRSHPSPTPKKTIVCRLQHLDLNNDAFADEKFFAVRQKDCISMVKRKGEPYKCNRVCGYINKVALLVWCLQPKECAIQSRVPAFHYYRVDCFVSWGFLLCYCIILRLSTYCNQTCCRCCSKWFPSSASRYWKDTHVHSNLHQLNEVIQDVARRAKLLPIAIARRLQRPKPKRKINFKTMSFLMRLCSNNVPCLLRSSHHLRRAAVYSEIY